MQRDFLATDRRRTGAAPGRRALLPRSDHTTSASRTPDLRATRRQRADASAAISDTYQTWLLNTMFAECATSAETPEDALKRADAKMKAIWAKWKERRMI